MLSCDYYYLPVLSSVKEILRCSRLISPRAPDFPAQQPETRTAGAHGRPLSCRQRGSWWESAPRIWTVHRHKRAPDRTWGHRLDANRYGTSRSRSVRFARGRPGRLIKQGAQLAGRHTENLATRGQKNIRRLFSPVIPSLPCTSLLC